MYADNISRIIDHDDWSITSEFYDHLNSMYGPFTLIVLLPRTLLNAENFIRNFGVRVLPALMLPALIGQTRTAG